MKFATYVLYKAVPNKYTLTKISHFSQNYMCGSYAIKYNFRENFCESVKINNYRIFQSTQKLSKGTLQHFTIEVLKNLASVNSSNVYN
jgi:hypothetical protein